VEEAGVQPLYLAVEEEEEVEEEGGVEEDS
jgi:hypothetical protein